MHSYNIIYDLQGREQLLLWSKTNWKIKRQRRLPYTISHAQTWEGHPVGKR